MLTTSDALPGPGVSDFTGRRAARSSRATRADVARLAGVSTAVVSYVVNAGPRQVAPATATRVREAMRMLGYQPNDAARALASGSTGMVGLIVADSLNPFFAEYTLELEKVATELGQQLLIADCRGDMALEARLIGNLLARQVDGLLIASTWGRPEALTAAHTGGVPVVFIHSDEPIAGFRTVGTDAAQGARDLVRHLTHHHGRRRVALVIGEGFGAPDPREKAWRAVLAEAGLPADTIVRVPFTWQGGYLGGRELLTRGTLPDAVFAASDRQAVGVLRAFHEHRIDVPGQVAIVSFDGTIPSAYTWPPLTVARQPLDQMSRAAWQLLADPEPAHREFGLDIVLRSSCGCPPAGGEPS